MGTATLKKWVLSLTGGSVRMPVERLGFLALCAQQAVQHVYIDVALGLFGSLALDKRHVRFAELIKYQGSTGKIAVDGEVMRGDDGF